MQENAEYKALGSLETNLLLSWKHKIAGEVKNKTNSSTNIIVINCRIRTTVNLTRRSCLWVLN